MNLFYADANFHRAITTGLKQRGIDVRTAQEDRADHLSDPDLLSRATEQGRVLLTHDTDFLSIGVEWQQRGQAFCGVLFVSTPFSIVQCIEDMELLAHAELPEHLANRVLFLPF